MLIRERSPTLIVPNWITVLRPGRLTKNAKFADLERRHPGAIRMSDERCPKVPVIHLDLLSPMLTLARAVEELPPCSLRSE